MDLDDADDEAYLLMAEQAEAAHTGGNGAAARPPACDPHGDRGTCDGAARSNPTYGGMGGSLSADPRANALGAIKQTGKTFISEVQRALSPPLSLAFYPFSPLALALSLSLSLSRSLALRKPCL